LRGGVGATAMAGVLAEPEQHDGGEAGTNMAAVISDTVGLAAAILIDATIVRAVLLPATMKLLGDRNWYLPKGLRWLPRFEHEPSLLRV
jgi:hypothetical protein